VAALLSSLPSAAAFAFHIAGARYFQIPLFYGLLFPIGYSTGALIAFDSLRWRLTHRVRWKDRVYP
jgi:chlorobactene glucosyltransferase